MITWQDRFFAEDKLFHFTGSFTAVVLLRYLIRLLGRELYLGEKYDHTHMTTRFRVGLFLVGYCQIIAFALVFLCGIALELYQWQTGTDVFSWKDLIWNTAGIAAAWGVMR